MMNSDLLQNGIALLIVTVVVTLFVRARLRARETGGGGCGSGGCGSCGNAKPDCGEKSA